MTQLILVVVLCCSMLSTYHAYPLDDSVTYVQYLERLAPSSLLPNLEHIGGLDVDGANNLVIFHRAHRKWTQDSFIGNEFDTEKYGPIKENVLKIVNLDTLESVWSTGANQFYMPHGVHIDYDGYIWLTDVAMHQVFKFDPSDFSQPILTLGTRLQSGSDTAHFCKPTSIAVSKSNGDVFVGDGYCNQRVVQFDHSGRFVREFKDNENPLIVVHSIALIDNLICATSREDGRIVCFDIESGEKKMTITDPSMNTVYAIKYDPVNQVIQAATGENRGALATILTFDATKAQFGKLLKIWSPNDVNLMETHDMAITLDGSNVLTGQLNGEIDAFYFERNI